MKKPKLNYLKAMDMSKEPNYMGVSFIGYYLIAINVPTSNVCEQVRYRCIEKFLKQDKISWLGGHVYLLTDDSNTIVEKTSIRHFACGNYEILCVHEDKSADIIKYIDGAMEFFFNDDFWGSEDYSDMEQIMKHEYYAGEIEMYSKSPLYYKISEWLDEHTEPDGHSFYFRETDLNDFIDGLVYEVVSDRVGENSFDPDKVLDIIFDDVKPQGLLERGLFGIMNRESDLMQVANGLSYEEKEKIKALAKLI